MKQPFEVSEMTTLAKRNENWREMLFERLLKEYGEEEAMRVAVSIQGQFPEMKDYLYDRARKQRKECKL